MIVFLFQTPTGNEIEMQKLRDTQTNRDDGLKLWLLAIVAFQF